MDLNLERGAERGSVVQCTTQELDWECWAHNSISSKGLDSRFGLVWHLEPGCWRSGKLDAGAPDEVRQERYIYSILSIRSA